MYHKKIAFHMRMLKLMV